MRRSYLATFVLFDSLGLLVALLQKQREAYSHIHMFVTHSTPLIPKFITFPGGVLLLYICVLTHLTPVANFSQGFRINKISHGHIRLHGLGLSLS